MTCSMNQYFICSVRFHIGVMRMVMLAGWPVRFSVSLLFFSRATVRSDRAFLALLYAY